MEGVDLWGQECTHVMPKSYQGLLGKSSRIVALGVLTKVLKVPFIGRLALFHLYLCLLKQSQMDVNELFERCVELAAGEPSVAACVSTAA